MPESEFFAPGMTYTRNLPYRAPEDRADFICVGVGANPRDGEPRAFGFYRGGSCDAWYSTALKPDRWQAGWVPVDADPDTGEPLVPDHAPWVTPTA